MLPEALEEIGVLSLSLPMTGIGLYFIFLKDSCWNPRRFISMFAKLYSIHVKIKLKREMKPATHIHLLSMNYSIIVKHNDH